MGHDGVGRMIARLLAVLMLLQVALIWRLGYWALALLLAVRVLILAYNFWQSRRAGSPVPAGFQLTMAGAFFLFLRELWADVRVSSWDMLFPCQPQLAPPVADLPVLLIHGYVCNRGFWSALRRQLARAGIVHEAIDLEPVTADIEQYVPQVERALDALCARTGAPQAIIVAHSMGGLVARAYLRRHGEERIARVITLGTPHHGTALANRAPGRNARQMSRPAGQPHAWLAQLAASEAAPRRALFTSIYSFHDNIVAPQESACLAGARNIAFGGLGHVALASDVRVMAWVIAEITIVPEVTKPRFTPHSG